MKTQTYKIGELARKTNISVATIRYYETQGLLNAKRSDKSGYRIYSSEQLQQLLFVLHAKKVGFSLKEIQQLLGLQLNRAEHTCETVKQYTGEKISELETKIHDLQQMKVALESLHQSCCGGAESAVNCSILRLLENPVYFNNKPFSDKKND